MLNSSNIRRDIVLLIIGTAIDALFGIVVAYPQLLADSRENAVRIESNRSQIERLWEAHEIGHLISDPQDGSR